MVVRQHDEGRAGRRVAHDLLRHRRQPRLDAFRHAVERLGARLDHDDVDRQQRERRRQRLADMAAAEEIDMRPRSASAGLRPHATSSSRRHASIDRPIRTDMLDRPPQHWPISGPSGTSSEQRPPPCRRGSPGWRRSICRALSIAMNSSWPPPIVPKIAVGETSIQAPCFARRRALGRRRPRPAPRRGWRVEESRAGCRRPQAHSAPAASPPQPLDRHQHALRRRRRVEARADLVVGDARHRIRQRMQHRHAEHEGRLADRLGAVDRSARGSPASRPASR